MKNSFVITMVLALILGLCGVVNAYSTDDYSIDIPSSYVETTKGSFLNEEGFGINIEVTNNLFVGDPYTEENLDKFVKEINDNMDSYRDEMVKSLKESYGAYYSDEYIKAYVDSFKCNSIDLKEITTVTKNNYKCFHIIANYQMGDYSYYCDQYQISSGDKLFTITISNIDKNNLLNDDMKKALDSFEIKGYSAPTEENKTLKYILIGAACGGAAGLLSFIFTKTKKKKENM